MITLRSEQLGHLIDLFEGKSFESNELTGIDPIWKTEAYIAGVGCVYDYRNYDFIKHRVKFPEAIRDIYKRFGILNLFNTFRPNGSYRLDLSIHEEKIVCKILFELAKVEGFGQMTNVTLNGKA